MNTKITWLGHSCFRIEKDGFALIIDPYTKDSVPGLHALDESADMVLKTHDHFDHNAVGEIKEKAPKAECPFDIETFKSYHDSKRGLLRGKNLIISIKSEEAHIVHMGDIGCVPSGKILKEIEGCDVLLIPAGGTYTVTAAEAVKLIEKIKPKTVIPMHFRKEPFGFSELQHLDEFKKLIKSFSEPGTDSVTVPTDSPVLILEPKYIIQ